MFADSKFNVEKFVQELAQKHTKSASHKGKKMPTSQKIESKA